MCFPPVPDRHDRHIACRGFSLVELSIVLVILGLLVGGVLGGTALIKAAELRAITTELQRYQTATNTFRAKYHALPGDMKNATQFWGTAPTCPALNPSHGTDGSATCNGDGNGIISHSVTNGEEKIMFWKHLANAGLVEGSYSGAPGAGHSDMLNIGVNIPRSKYGGGGWVVTDMDHNRVSPQVWKGPGGSSFMLDYGHVFFIGGEHNVMGGTNPVLAPEDAWSIDMKMDDGKPGRGSIIAWPASYGDCNDAGSATNLDADYLLAETSKACALFFRQVF